MDHIVFYGDLSSVCAAFGRLGFTVSPRGAYVLSDDSDRRWPNRCVFLQRGWFDFLEAEDRGLPTAPAGCLFLAENLEAQLAGLSDLSPASAAYDLERRWDMHLGVPPEVFRVVRLKAGICPLPVAVIEHDYPGVDILPAWLEHPNGATTVEGLVFRDSDAGPDARAAAQRLDLSGLTYWQGDRFDRAFPAPRVRIAVRVKVASLELTRATLLAHGVRTTVQERSICATPEAGLDCGFMFTEDVVNSAFR